MINIKCRFGFHRWYIGRGVSNEEVAYSEEYCFRCGLVHGEARPTNPVAKSAFVQRAGDYEDICDEGLRTIALALALGETVEFKERRI